MALSCFCRIRNPVCSLEVFCMTTISVSSKDHRFEIEALSEISGYDIKIKSAEAGDRIDVTFDDLNLELLQVIISILSSTVEGESDDEDGSRKGRRRWIGDDVITVNEKDAEKMLKVGLGRKGMAYDGDGKWTVSREAWTAFEIWKKLKAVKAKAKENYRGR